MSNLMMQSLLGYYIIIGVVCIFEKNYPKALYWFSAGLLTVSILWGMK